MKRNLAGVIAVAIAALLFAGCGSTDSTVPDATTTTTAVKTVVDSYCGDMGAAVTAGLMSKQEYSDSMMLFVTSGDLLGVITMVWSDGSITPTKEQCIWKDGLSPEERGLEIKPYAGPRK